MLLRRPLGMPAELGYVMISSFLNFVCWFETLLPVFPTFQFRCTSSKLHQHVLEVRPGNGCRLSIHTLSTPRVDSSTYLWYRGGAKSLSLETAFFHFQVNCSSFGAHQHVLEARP
jgi:hypothetical protein